jgi:hypothetical protein
VGLQQVLHVAVQFRIVAAAGREEGIPFLGRNFSDRFDEDFSGLVDVRIHDGTFPEVLEVQCEKRDAFVRKKKIISQVSVM